MLENSLNTDFPAGSQLSLTRTGDFLALFVTDSSGVSVVRPLSTNCIFSNIYGEQPVHVGTQTQISKTGNSGDSIVSSLSETATEVVAMGYDDRGLTTRDGTHTHFQITFLATRKTSVNLVTQQMKDIMKFQQAQGYGVVRDRNVIIEGTGTAQISGMLFTPPQ